MGDQNSSKTRVVPIFERLFLLDSLGVSWLPGLLRLGSRSSDVLPKFTAPRLIENHDRTWGDAELSLPAPLGLLEYLVQNITELQVAHSGDTGITLEKRQALARHHSPTIEEALNKLRAGRRGRKWYVLEGPSSPDATLEMPEAVLIIEGKRTERSCTSATKWMSQRSQLLRHMDAAFEYFQEKIVLGLLLVEGDGGADAVTPSQFWCNQSIAQYSSEMLAASLPHRSQNERDRLSRGILGVSTWQAVCMQNGIPWPPEGDIKLGRLRAPAPPRPRPESDAGRNRRGRGRR